MSFILAFRLILGLRETPQNLTAFTGLGKKISAKMMVTFGCKHEHQARFTGGARAALRIRKGAGH
jgi:hypothetical protein